jgi:hypothetical protein
MAREDICPGISQAKAVGVDVHSGFFADASRLIAGSFNAPDTFLDDINMPLVPIIDIMSHWGLFLWDRAPG